LTSSAWAFAKAAANAATDSLDLGMSSYLVEYIKAYRARFRTFGADSMPDGLLDRHPGNGRMLDAALNV
jgi:hypothetical protein